MTDLVFKSARELSALLVSKSLSARELLDASLAQIDRHNPALNAVVTLDRDGAYANADAVDARRMRGDPTSPLAGLPIAVKDMEPVKGMRTTKGSPILKDWIPDYDTMMVERFRNHGLTILGKTNVPEFALGSQTFNTIFGATKNPWDVTKTCGGSSGGAAVGVATGMFAFADGSDMGGSLRNPANFCGMVGLRPSPGRVPDYPVANLWGTLGVHGPIARTAEDAAWLLSVQAGDDPRVTMGCCGDPTVYREPLDRDFSGVRIAYAPTLGGLPVEKQVREALDASIKRFEALGAIVEEAEPDLAIADNAFQVLRGLHLLGSMLPLYKSHKHLMKDTAVWNVEQGLKLTGEQISEAQLQQSKCFERMQRFLTKYEYLICPVNQVAPFDVTMPYPMQIDGVQLETYLDWMKSAFRITMTSHPAASAPVAFTKSGLPVGMQIVGRHGCEREVLQLVHAVELPLAERLAASLR
ncbi:MAG: amidase [Betaproteobacteria bacterium]|nr:MAG: amidase [Betaproteobacteria bacterium]